MQVGRGGSVHTDECAYLKVNGRLKDRPKGVRQGLVHYLRNRFHILIGQSVFPAGPEGEYRCADHLRE